MTDLIAILTQASPRLSLRVACLPRTFASTRLRFLTLKESARVRLHRHINPLPPAARSRAMEKPIRLPGDGATARAGLSDTHREMIRRHREDVLSALRQIPAFISGPKSWPPMATATGFW